MIICHEIHVTSAHSNPSAFPGQPGSLRKEAQVVPSHSPAAPGTSSIYGVCVETAPTPKAASDLSS